MPWKITENCLWRIKKCEAFTERCQSTNADVTWLQWLLLQLASMCSVRDCIQGLCFDVLKIEPLVDVLINLTNNTDVVTPDNVETQDNLNNKSIMHMKTGEHNFTCSTPWLALNTLSWVSSSIKFMVWSKPCEIFDDQCYSNHFFDNASSIQQLNQLVWKIHSSTNLGYR